MDVKCMNDTRSTPKNKQKIPWTTPSEPPCRTREPYSSGWRDDLPESDASLMCRFSISGRTYMDVSMNVSHLHVELVVVPWGQLGGLELLKHVASVGEGGLRVAGILGFTTRSWLLFTCLSEVYGTPYETIATAQSCAFGRGRHTHAAPYAPWTES